MFGRQKIATLVAEFLGTGFLTLLVISVQRSTIGVTFFVAMTAGLTIALLYFAFGRLSGGYFNPALTLAMWTTRKLTTARTLVYLAAQFAGAYAAYALYRYYAKTAMQPIPGEFSGRLLTAEAVGAGLLALTFAAAYYQKLTTAMRGTVYGIGYMVAALSASTVAVGLVNPALALADLGAHSWVLGAYVLGPILGAVVGANLYHYLFAPAMAEVVVATVVSPTVSAKPVVKTAVARKTRKSAATKSTTRKSTTKVATKRKK